MLGHVGLQLRAADLPIGDVELKQAPLPTGCLQAGQGGFGAGTIAVVVHHDGKTVGRQLEGDGAAYPLLAPVTNTLEIMKLPQANKSDNSPGLG